MNVGELKKLLADIPDDLTVIYSIYSDYRELLAGEIEVVEAVDQGGYIMRSHPSMSQDNKARTRKYLAFPGN